MLRALTFLLVVLITFGCDSTFDTSRLDNALANSSWLFERAETNEGNVDHEPTLSRRASIDFGDRQENATTYEVAGYYGCNIFSGSYSVDGEALQFMQIVQTERACMSVEGRIEDVFSRGIRNARSYSFDGDVLVIHAPGQSLKLRFVPAGAIVD